MAGFKVPRGKLRSGEWPRVRREFLASHQECAACGGRNKLEAHHIKPFHLFPKLELEPKNLVALCEGNTDVNCHLLFGHLLNFSSFNKTAARDAAAWAKKINGRPR